MKIQLLALVLLLLSGSTGLAQRADDMIDVGGIAGHGRNRVETARPSRHARGYIAYDYSYRTHPTRPMRERGVVLGGRPAGCPHRFCGCALALKLFGRHRPELNLAANWLRFPRSAPQSGAVAARRGHVFLLLRHVGGSVWVVWDPNSGGGKTREHARSISGYTIVNVR